jgi:hypothetical protein
MYLNLHHIKFGRRPSIVSVNKSVLRSELQRTIEFARPYALCNEEPVHLELQNKGSTCRASVFGGSGMSVLSTRADYTLACSPLNPSRTCHHEMKREAQSRIGRPRVGLEFLLRSGKQFVFDRTRTVPFALSIFLPAKQHTSGAHNLLTASSRIVRDVKKGNSLPEPYLRNRAETIAQRRSGIPCIRTRRT